jgi:hypothetical protein
LLDVGVGEKLAIVRRDLRELEKPQERDLGAFRLCRRVHLRQLCLDARGVRQDADHRRLVGDELGDRLGWFVAISRPTTAPALLPKIGAASCPAAPSTATASRACCPIS